ncbi:hypothetical protein [Streptomyces sp. NPDC012888]|uniref:hypothetical protein n=1 Tax=Streptomyces sp. NPDC012888 TaxID=3364855 RepID=UPI0036C26DD8
MASVGDDLKNLVGDGEGNESTEEWSVADIQAASQFLSWLAGETGDESGTQVVTTQLILDKLSKDGPQIVGTTGGFGLLPGLPAGGGSNGPDGINQAAQHTMDKYNAAVKNAPFEQGVQTVFNTVGKVLQGIGSTVLSAGYSSV